MTAIQAAPAEGPSLRYVWRALLLVALAMVIPLAVLAQVSLIAMFVALVLLAAIAGAMWLAAARPALFGALFIVGFSAQPMLKFYVSPYFGPAKDAVIVVAVGLLCVALYARGFPSHMERWICYLLLALCGLYVVNVGGHHDAAWAAAARLTLEASGLFLVGFLAPQARDRWIVVRDCLIVVGCVEALLGLAQQVIGTRALVTDFGFAFGEQVRETATGQLRSFGTFDDPFSYAGLLLLALVVLTQHRPRERSTLGVGAVLTLGIYVSYDRTAVVLMAVVLGLWIWRLGHRVSVVLLGVALVVSGGLVLAALSASRTEAAADPLETLTSLNGRTALWSQVIGGPWHLVAGRGVGAVGTGLARSQAGLIVEQQAYVPGHAPAAADLSKLYSVDNSYLAIVADVGLPGLLLLLGVGAHVIGFAWRSRECEALRFSLVGLVVVAAVDGLTRSSLFAFPSGFITMYVIGTACAALLEESADASSSREVVHAA